MSAPDGEGSRGWPEAFRGSRSTDPGNGSLASPAARNAAPEEPLTVSALTARIRALFQGEEFRSVRIVGELSNFKHHLGRHMYFRLKDAGAQIACAFYHPANTRLGFAPRDGMQVVATGYVGVYEARGEYQLYVRSLEQSGLGDLYRALEDLKRRLREEGLTDPARRRPLPRFPRRIGIVASAESAGLKDMLTALARRWPLAEVVLEPVAVEGAASAPSIAAGLARMAKRGDVDVVITGRGGGSIESLWGFNTEVVARAIAAMPVPVVTAVGHETDTTVADLVADRRAITPTEAVELVTPDRDEIGETLAGLASRALRRLRAISVSGRDRLAYVGRALRSPDRLLDQRVERVARLGERVAALVESRLAVGATAARRLRDRAAARSPERRVAERRARVATAARTVCERARGILATRSARVGILGARLEALSPLAVLARGYAVVIREGRAVRDGRDLEPGDDLALTFAAGAAEARVTAVRGGMAAERSGRKETGSS